MAWEQIATAISGNQDRSYLLRSISIEITHNGLYAVGLYQNETNMALYVLPNSSDTYSDYNTLLYDYRLKYVLNSTVKYATFIPVATNTTLLASIDTGNISGSQSISAYIEREMKPNTAPTIPGGFTQPIGTLEIGDTKVVSWGASSDAHSNLSKYVLEASVNNGGYTVIAQPTTPTFSYTVPTATSVKFRVKAVDAAGLESAYRESALLTVTKPMYYWSKSESDLIWQNPDDVPWGPRVDNALIPDGLVMGSEFLYNPKATHAGGIGGATIQISLYVQARVNYYWSQTDHQTSPSYVDISQLTIPTANRAPGNAGWLGYYQRKRIVKVWAKGPLVQSNITAAEGTYPTDGRHSDGFWYVRGSRVSQSIAPPSAFTVPATGSTLLPKQSLTLAFGASTAPSISTYEVQSRYNGGAWVNVGTHTNALTRAFTVTTDKLLTTVEYRVRAKNTSNVYSDYIHSEVFAIQHNAAPTMTLSTTDSRTLYESDNYGIIGTATDTDSGDVITVMYQINGGEKRAILTHISTGAAIPFNLTLTFKGGMLYNGAVAVTPVLSEGGQHTLRVWAEDNQGGTPAEQTRVFYVVPNRPASLTINPFSSATDLINTDAMTVSGSVSDPDNNTVTVKYKIANGSYTEIYSGSGGSFSFQLLLSTLAIGVNTITIQATDNYGAVTSKTLQVTKAENTQPLKTAVTRYKMTPPNGTAKGVLLWIEREVGDLVVDVEISMGMAGEAENFVPMTKKGTAFVTDGIEEDEFLFEADSAKENIVLKLTMTRSSTASEKGITLISGVLS
ncbi:hypothetical protein [Sporosarcina psychrophila]|uniref:Fibronectin type-III domain-containing protein n=1 Tax=Sporosarcina psychrophila TaxID=1476 RepID=A0ABV2KCS8_SPOPS